VFACAVPPPGASSTAHIRQPPPEPFSIEYQFDQDQINYLIHDLFRFRIRSVTFPINQTFRDSRVSYRDRGAPMSGSTESTGQQWRTEGPGRRGDRGGIF
jgi:hypothetical protein